MRGCSDATHANSRKRGAESAPLPIEGMTIAAWRKKPEAPERRRKTTENVSRGAASARRRDLERALRAAADPRRAASVAKFFKTGKGEYGEGDRFIGIPVPVLRKIARQHAALGFDDLDRLLASPIHEFRSAALEILVAQYQAADEARRERIIAFYLRQTQRMNNWDLVDTAAPCILGEHLKTRSRQVLYRLAVSKSLWERRIAMVATLALIRSGEIEDAHRIAKKLLTNDHDLIHKAVGWMLRESGKISEHQLVEFFAAELFADSAHDAALRH